MNQWQKLRNAILIQAAIDCGITRGEAHALTVREVSEFLSSELGETLVCSVTTDKKTAAALKEMILREKPRPKIQQLEREIER
jgi:hypothetical protein